MSADLQRLIERTVHPVPAPLIVREPELKPAQKRARRTKHPTKMRQVMLARASITPEFIAGLDAEVAACVKRGAARFGFADQMVVVALLMASGASQKEIARRLNVSINTVSDHESRLYQRVRIGNRVRAVARLIAAGMLP